LTDASTTTLSKRSTSATWSIIKTFSIDADIINSKTFLGPLIWFHIYRTGSLVGIATLQSSCICSAVFHRLCPRKGRYDTRTIILALFLFAFYAGTNRNIAAGEPDDNIAALLFGLGVLLYLNTGRVFASALLMGVAFLFKFWIAVFCEGFGIYLLTQRSLRPVWLAGIAMAVPFLLINYVDGFQSMRSLVISLNVQKGISPWQSVGFKLLSTGMIFSLLASAWTWLKRKNKPTLSSL
jgi:hypothetical protein